MKRSMSKAGQLKREEEEEEVVVNCYLVYYYIFKIEVTYLFKLFLNLFRVLKGRQILERRGERRSIISKI